MRPVQKAFIALSLLGLAACGGSPADQQLDRRTLLKAEAILEDVLRTELGLSPQSASSLGLLEYAPEDAVRRLDDYSQAGFERTRLVRIDLLNRLRTSPAMPPRHPLARDLRILLDGLERLNLVQQTGQGRIAPSLVRPYAIDPISGIWSEGPYLLKYEHPIRSFEDAQTWLLRLSAVSQAYDDTRRRLIAESHAGLTPPKLVLEETAAVLKRVHAEDAIYDDLLFTFENLLASTSQIGRPQADMLLDQAKAIIDIQIMPAHGALVDSIQDLAEEAPQLPGLQSQPKGYETWRSLLAWYSPELKDARDLHAEHLSEVRARQTDFDQVLAAFPEELQPFAGDGAALLAALDLLKSAESEASSAEESVAPPASARRLAIRETAMLPRSVFSSDTLPASLDRRRPHLLRVHEQDMQVWGEPWRSYHILWHDNEPAQKYLQSLAEAAEQTSARIIFQPADFKLGWEAYGLFDLRPLTLDSKADFEHAYLTAKMNLLIAVLATVDTGMHTQRWSLEDCVNYIRTTSGLSETLAEHIALITASAPGEASARLFGQARFQSLETRVRAILGDRFDLADFQNVLISDGPRPFAMVEQDVERWYEGQIDRALGE